MYDLTDFQRDLLYVIAGLDDSHGLAIIDDEQLLLATTPDVKGGAGLALPKVTVGGREGGQKTRNPAGSSPKRGRL